MKKSRWPAGVSGSRGGWKRRLTAASALGINDTVAGCTVTHSGGTPVTVVSNCSTTVLALTIVSVVPTDSPGLTASDDSPSAMRTPRFCGARGGGGRVGCCGWTGAGPGASGCVKPR
jgi:hypothetical protein